MVISSLRPLICLKEAVRHESLVLCRAFVFYNAATNLRSHLLQLFVNDKDINKLFH